MSTTPRARPTPAQDLSGYLKSYTEEMAFGDEDPGTVLDRYCSSDFVHCNDGVELDRDRLIAHAKPVRKNAVSCELDIHDALVTDDGVAARYTMYTTMRKGAVMRMEVYMFGQLAPDGRLRRIDSTTRNLKPRAEGTSGRQPVSNRST